MATISIITQPVDIAVCTGDIAIISTTATGADNLNYQWQYSPDGVVPFADIADGAEYSNTTTPALSANTNNDFGAGRYRCNISGDFANPVMTDDMGLSFLTTGCAPQITIAPLTTTPGGKVILDLKPLITTIGTLDVSSIMVIEGPASKALATVENGILTVDYAGLLFSGTEPITIEACNTNGICSQQNFIIEVVADILVYNAVSANGDDKNATFRIEFIDALTTTKTNTVSIYNRWGDEVFSVSDYDNKTRVFAGLSNSGHKLPSGIYYYKISLPLQGKTMTGFLDLRQ
jgi:gliding motility-associated-like protein